MKIPFYVKIDNRIIRIFSYKIINYYYNKRNRREEKLYLGKLLGSKDILSLYYEDFDEILEDTETARMLYGE